jgi:hypothetical protein
LSRRPAGLQILSSEIEILWETLRERAERIAHRCPRGG